MSFETVIEVDKRDFITLTCKACGHVSEVDPRHKLNTFIIKNPPKAKASNSEKSLRRAEKEREAVGEALVDALADEVGWAAEGDLGPLPSSRAEAG